MINEALGAKLAKYSVVVDLTRFINICESDCTTARASEATHHDPDPSIVASSGLRICSNKWHQTNSCVCLETSWM